MTQKKQSLVKLKAVDADLDSVEAVVAKFDELLPLVNKNNPIAEHLAAFRSLLADNKDLRLWERIAGPGATAERIALNADNCLPESYPTAWYYRLQQMRNESTPV